MPRKEVWGNHMRYVGGVLDTPNGKVRMEFRAMNIEENSVHVIWTDEYSGRYRESFTERYKIGRRLLYMKWEAKVNFDADWKNPNMWRPYGRMQVWTFAKKPWFSLLPFYPSDSLMRKAEQNLLDAVMKKFEDEEYKQMVRLGSLEWSLEYEKYRVRDAKITIRESETNIQKIQLLSEQEKQH